MCNVVYICDNNSEVYIWKNVLCTHISRVHKQTNRTWTRCKRWHTASITELYEHLRKTKYTHSHSRLHPHNTYIWQCDQRIAMRQRQHHHHTSHTHKKIIKFLYGKIINKKLKPTNWYDDMCVCVVAVVCLTTWLRTAWNISLLLLLLLLLRFFCYCCCLYNYVQHSYHSIICVKSGFFYLFSLVIFLIPFLTIWF